MNLFQISDLHIGKQLYFYNLIPNQVEILNQIVQKIIEYKPDVLLICGDIYDRSVPSAEAVAVFDEFLNSLAGLRPQIPVLIIGGNHDNAERLSYAASFLKQNQIYISAFPPQKEEEHLTKVTLTDSFGEVDFWLLPFTKPGYVRGLFEEGTITGYESAIRELLARESIDFSRRNVLLSHQFYINGEKYPDTCESESGYLNVGNLDSVDVDAIRNFDYVALGHLHGAQQAGSGHIRYCGTPLKYSVSEEKHSKAITRVCLQEKGTKLQIESIPLVASQDVRKIKGTLQQLIEQAENANCHDFLSVTLCEEQKPYRAKEMLEEYYDYLLEIRVDNEKTRALLQETEGSSMADLEPMAAFEEFYFKMQGVTLSEEETKIMRKIIQSAKEIEDYEAD